MAYFLQLLIFGLQIGSVYALLALGYSMVFGIIKLINMAHGDFLMLGALTAYFVAQAFISYQTKSGFPVIFIILIILSAMITSGIIGVATEAIAYKPIRGRSGLATMITAMGVSMFLENFPKVFRVIGADFHPLPRLFPKTIIDLSGVTINTTQIILICTSLVVMLVLFFITEKTSLGHKMKAVSMDKDASALMGIDINKTISVTFFIGAALAALSGIFYACLYPQVHVYMGGWIGQKAFIAAVVGGIGDMRGAVLGGYILGIVEIFATTINSGLGYAITFVLLIVILLVKPSGIMNAETIEKV